MNPIAKMLIDMAKFYDQALDERQLEMYIQVLSQLPQETVLMCGREYMQDLKNVRFPIPPHIILKKHLRQKPGARELAIASVDKINKAIHKFGYPDPGGAREYLGAELWEVINMHGGWMKICEGPMIAETMYAQFRDSVESFITLSAMGIYAESHPQLGERRGELETIDKILIGTRNEI